MNKQLLNFQKYFYLKYLKQSSSTHRMTYWVKLDTRIDCHQLMYALLNVVQHQPVLRSQFNIDDSDDLCVSIREFFPFIELKAFDDYSKNIDIESFFQQKLNSYYLNQLPQFNFTIYQFLDEAYLLLDFHSMIFNDNQLQIFLSELNKAYKHSLNQHAGISQFYMTVQKINEKACNPNAPKDFNQFKVLHADNENYAYMPVKNVSDKKEMRYVRTQLSSFDIHRLAVSTYLAHHFMSQSNEVALNIHFPVANKQSELLMVPNSNVSPVCLYIDQHASVDSLLTAWTSAIHSLQNHGASFITEANADVMELESMFHVTPVVADFELHQVSHEVHRLYNNKSSLANIEIYPLANGGFDLVYDANAYDDLTIQTLRRLITTIYMQSVNQPTMLVQEIQLNDQTDLQLYERINSHSMTQLNGNDAYQTVMSRFEYQVNQHPDAIALQFEQQSMTYRQLNQQANYIAHLLRTTYGIQPNDTVALIMERSMEMIVAILGILKSGAGYLPIDPDYPQERTHYILKDAMPKAIITYHITLQSDLPLIKMEEINWDECTYIDNLPHINTPEDTAYVIYTSGTTGKPKGTVIAHRGIDRLVHQPNYVELNDDTVILLSGTIAFDAATFEIYGALLNGGRLIITSKDTLLDSKQLGQTIADKQVNTMWLTSSLFNQIASERIEVLESLKYLLIGGEVLNAKWVNLLNSRARHPQIINGYGPTENTTFTTTYAIPPKLPARIPIGSPINGTTVYVIQGQRLCGVGVPGELCIGGSGLAKGYLNQPEQTQQSFVKSPLNGEAIYKSGDLVRLQEDGNIDYISRIDKQVKIRGFRIELSEIEKAIEAIRDINKAVVVVHEHEQDRDKQIVAYYEASQPQSTSTLKKLLSHTLPNYMIPVHFMKIDKIPITINGKLDTRALPDIDMIDESNYVAPRNELERVLCRIFEEILHVDRVGIKDNFFELGGHSLRATLVVNRIEEQLQKRLKVGDIMKSPTVKALSQQLKETQNEHYEVIPKASEDTQYELSAVQKSMYLLWSVNPKDTVYNIPFLWRLTSELNVDQLQRSLSQLIQRHEILRTQYIIDHNEVKQRIAKDVIQDFEEVTTDLTDEQDIIHAYTHPFNLEKPSQIRMKYIHSPEHHYLFIDTHHSINDGMSNTILLADLNALYQNKSLPQLSLQYRDYSEWMAQRDLSTQRHYWLEQFEDGVPVLNMPTDYPRPSIKTTHGHMMTFHYDQTFKSQLKSYVEQHQITDFMFFASAIMVLLHKYTRQDDLVIGSVISSRTHRDTENMLGMFANTLVYRGQPTNDKPWEQFISEMKETSLAAYEQQEYPFESLVNDLVGDRDPSRNPLFDVMLVLQNNETNHANFGHSRLTLIPPQSTTAKFDLSFIIEEDYNDYTVNIEYNTDLYSKATIQLMAQQLENIFKYVITTSNPKIKEIQEDPHILDWINTNVNCYTRDDTTHETVQQRFNRVVKQHSEDVALRMNGQSMTYQTLDAYANQLAYELTVNGVQSGDRIALLTERSFEMIISMVAAIKVGASYVPIDVAHPDKRIDYMIKDAQASAVITYGKDIHMNIPTIALETLELTNNNKRPFSEYAGSLEDEIYCIYTSGTTGMPKGVSIQQSNILNLVNAWTDRLELSEHETIIQYSNYVFDASAMDIYSSLLNGHTLVIANKNERTNTELLEQLITKEAITVASIPLQVLNVMHQFYIPKIITGGATSTPSFVQHIAKHCDTYYNAYGPSESTVVTTTWSHAKGDPIPSTIPIGQPLANIQVYIVSEMQLCGIGIAGELCIAGDSLAAGYLNQPELNAQAFIDNPFGTGKLYRSGDLARFTPDGNIEFLGRIDKQVKVNGYRIELEEIENVINALDGVDDSVVIIRQQGGHDLLHAYYVGNHDIASHLLKQLTQYLPKYMIPNTFTAIDEIPLTSNDKVDESKLPNPEMHHHQFEPPRNDTEQIFASIMAEILDISEIGIDDDFFKLGGSSLDTMVLISKLKRKHIHLTMQDIYQYKTIRHLSAHLEQQSDESCVTLPDHLPQLQSLIKQRYQMRSKPMIVRHLGHVLLTGATGFLGAYLINELTGYTDKITCVVRGQNKKDARQLVEENLSCYFDPAHVADLMIRVEVVLGEFSNLDVLNITSHIDTIIHAGARTDHFGDDEAFINVNVKSTEDLLTLAETHKARFIYISTISVGTVFDSHAEDYTFSEQDLYKGQLFTSPYTKSKFYSEIKVLEAIEAGLDAQIMRLGNLTSAYTGKLNMKNLTTNRFSIVMNDLLKLPFIGDSFSQTEIEFSFIDITARDIVTLAISNATPIIYHVYSPHVLTMKNVLEETKDTDLPLINDEEFDKALHELNMHEVIGLNSQASNQITGVIQSSMTQNLLRDLDEVWPKVTQHWLYQWRELLNEKFECKEYHR